jgi:hypothetical protein
MLQGRAALAAGPRGQGRARRTAPARGRAAGSTTVRRKGDGGRALTYPLATLIVPVAWWLVRRRRRGPVGYPYALDILLASPFLVDTLGNALDLYDSIDWWDDPTTS